MLDATGVAKDEAEEATESPFLFVALTVNVYEVPFVSPAIVKGDELPEIVAPLLAITV